MKEDSHANHLISHSTFNNNLKEKINIKSKFT